MKEDNSSIKGAEQARSKGARRRYADYELMGVCCAAFGSFFAYTAGVPDKYLIPILVIAMAVAVVGSIRNTYNAVTTRG